MLVLAMSSSWLNETRASEALMENHGCISCHRVDRKMIGPSFRQIAARYRSEPQAAERLFAKVRAGGEGEWDDVPMQPNPPEKISDEDLQAVIRWILTLPIDDQR
jgi:cytochrome c